MIAIRIPCGIPKSRESGEDLCFPAERGCPSVIRQISSNTTVTFTVFYLTQNVSQFPTEVSTMLMLHKIEIGVALLAALLAGIATAEPEKDPAWKAVFRKAYGLKDDELIRRVAPPYPK